MQIDFFVNNPFQENCYIVSEGKDAIIIDCGAYYPREEERIRQYLQENGLTPKAHLLTHAHLDHLFGARFLLEEYGLKPYLHPADAFLFRQVAQQAEMFGLPLRSAPVTEFLPLALPKEGNKRAEGTLLTPALLGGEGSEIYVIETPGHTPGGVCYRIGEALFSGDTLFNGGAYGRTDLPGGDYGELMGSLSRLESLPPFALYPGHGY